MKYILTEKELEVPEGIKVSVKSRTVTVEGNHFIN
jgi:ribosomal protein L6P/L9E